jgi:hypothetical protein
MQPTNPDESNLKLLAMLYYIWAGLHACAGLVGVLFIVAGTFLTVMPQFLQGQNGNPPPPWFGAVFTGLGVLFFIFIEAGAVMMFLVGRNISRRVHHTYCMVIAGINCLSVPFGTILGIFTIVTLQKPSVRAMFYPPPAQPVYPNPSPDGTGL